MTLEAGGPNYQEPQVPKPEESYRGDDRTWRRVILTSLILIGLNFCCDNGWFIIGRFTEVDWWMTEIGIVFWSVVGGLLLEKWLHKWVHGHGK